MKFSFTRKEKEAIFRYYTIISSFRNFSYLLVLVYYYLRFVNVFNIVDKEKHLKKKNI